MTTIAVVGLGYVGLPLALKFGEHFQTYGFDISESKIEAYKNHIDPADEVSVEDFAASTFFVPTTDPSVIKEADFVIIAMPTPVNSENIPDFKYLEIASKTVGSNLKPGAIVVYESTVYPGATEEICVPILEHFSGMKWKEGFNVGYSPERISPGDKVMPLVKLKKIVSGDTQEVLEKISSLYKIIIVAGVYEAKSIQVAEAAKVVENIQRDINIALMNELAMIFPTLGLDTNDVIDAAASKWNFVNYRPGLVGGHCIGVDPYYLIHRAATFKKDTPFLSLARETNNRMVDFVVKNTVAMLTNAKNVAVVGLTFKEGCKDIRNSKMFELISEYKKYGLAVHAVDPVADGDEIFHEYGVNTISIQDLPQCDLIVLASPHKELIDEADQLLDKLVPNGIFADLKGKIDRKKFENRDVLVWRL